MNDFKIGERRLGSGCPTYIIAELSANHGQDFDLAVRTVHAMKDAGADAVKVQTYTADSMTLKSSLPPFVIGGGTIWDGKLLHALYEEAAMPWEWQPELKKIANHLGMDFFSTPFDLLAVDFLEQMDVPAYKIASFEIVDLPLLRKVASTGKPVILSTGMSTESEIREALDTLRSSQSGPVVLLKCTSAYPACPEEMNLLTLPDMATRFGTAVGLSDHTMGSTVPVVSVALGACIVEKHMTLSRKNRGPDSSFSMEPDEFKAMVDAIRVSEKALGRVSYEVAPSEKRSRVFRRSIFAAKDIEAGESFTAENVRVIRPAHGLHPRHLEQILGCVARVPVKYGTPLSWDVVQQ